MPSWQENQRSAHSPETRLHQELMRLMVGSDRQSQNSAEQITSLGEWTVLFDLCAQWKLLAGLEARIAALGISLPDADHADLSRRTQPAFLQTMLCIRAGATALSALEQAGIPCAGFKGLAALAYLYTGFRSRTLQDTDALIRPRDVESALTVLEAAGFKRSPDSPWEEYVAFLRNSPGTAGNEAVSLRDERGGCVDLHWHLGSLEVETLLAGARPAQVLNRPLTLMSPAHCMLLSVHHALRNDFVPGDIARDVCDFAHWRPLLDKTGQWQAVSVDAERWGLSAACAALALIVAELRGEEDPEPPLPLSRADRAVARQLAAFYFHQLLAGPINTDLAYVASARPLRQVAAGLAGGWKTYREFMRRSEESNGEASLAVHERLWNLGKSVTALSRDEWRQVRALARAKDKMAGPRRTPQGNRETDPAV
jgi:hypothetical protein